MTNIGWDLIRAIHSDKTGVPPHIVDYIAVYDILKFCVSGKSIDVIAESLEFDSDYVVETIKKFLYFDGWLSNLGIEPYQLFIASLQDSRKYRQIISYLSSLDDYDITSSYRACCIFYKIEQELKNYEYVTNAS